MYQNKIKITRLLNFSDLTKLSIFFGHDLCFKLIFGCGLIFSGSGLELIGPFTTLLRKSIKKLNRSILLYLQFKYKTRLKSCSLRLYFVCDLAQVGGSKLQRRSRGHKARGQGQSQGHKKNPRPRLRTAFPRTDTLEAKNRNARGQGQGPRTQAQVLSKKKKIGLHKNFFRRSPKKKKGLHKNFSSDLHKKTFSKKFFKRSTKF